MNDLDEIKSRCNLRDIFEGDGHALKRIGQRLFCLCPFHEEKSRSCCVDKERFHCFGCRAGGNLFHYIKRRDTCDFAEAIRKAGVIAGMNHTLPLPRIPSQRRALRPISGQSVPDTLPEMPEATRAQWHEGVNYLLEKQERIEKLAAWRGWPADFAGLLASCGLVSMPQYHGERTIAFLVNAPELVGGKLVMRDLGFHARLKPRPGEAKASWRFLPNEREHGHSIPALPFVIAPDGIDKARLVVIHGGQWDSLTFAHASGWLASGAQWPLGTCLIGLRGDSSHQVFLSQYGRFWPRDCDCLVMPDGDASGARWKENDSHSFKQHLARSFRRVAVASCAPHKDFNDAFRADKITPEQIAGLIESCFNRAEKEAA